MVAILNRRRANEPVACAGHHYHLRSGFADPATLIGRSRWACCHCGDRQPADGPAPVSAAGCAEPLDRAESITAWLSGDVRRRTPGQRRPRTDVGA